MSAVTKFVVGDKVKIPTTKCGRDLSLYGSSSVVRNAIERKQDYLYITKIYTSKGLTPSTYVLSIRKDDSGDYFHHGDLEHYSYIKPKAPKQITAADIKAALKDAFYAGTNNTFNDFPNTPELLDSLIDTIYNKAFSHE